MGSIAPSLAPETKNIFRGYIAPSKSRRTQRVKNQPLASDKAWSVTKVWMNKKYRGFIMRKVKGQTQLKFFILS